MGKQNGGLASFFANGHAIPEEIVYGTTPAMQTVRRVVQRAAQASVPVLILGKSGTGKEVIAKEIHRGSPWSKGPFAKVSCPAIPGTLLESELFGYEKGAFTGAWNTKPGRVELAHQGTLFLDEIAEMDQGLQAKLLQLLQDGQVSRIGGKSDYQVDVRIICATNRQLEAAIEAGTFRQDLFYRINVLSIQLPSLRERLEDIPLLANYFLEVYNRQHHRQVRPLSREIIDMMCQYEWPGNIRELENLIRRHVILDSKEELVNQLLTRKRNGSPARDLDDTGPVALKVATKRAVEEVERELILKVLHDNHWNRKKAAQALQISYRALLYKIKQAGLPSKRTRAVQSLATDEVDPVGA